MAVAMLGVGLVLWLGMGAGGIAVETVSAEAESQAAIGGASAALDAAPAVAVDDANALVLGDAKTVSVVVSNVYAQQYGSFVWVAYDLAVTPSGPVPVALSASTDGGLTYDVTPAAVYGAVGDSVEPGTDLIAVWNVYEDLPEQQVAEMAVWVETTPASGGSGIPESNLFTVDARLEWLDANGDGTPDDLFDFDQDGVPDVAQDFDGNGVPDAFEDTDGNGTPDAYQDLDFDGTPDGFRDADADHVPDWFQGRLTLYSPTHPDGNQWYFSPDITVEYPNYMAGADLYGYLWAMDQNENTVVDYGGTFRAAADPKEVSFTASVSGTWYFHIAAVGQDHQIIAGSQGNLGVNVYVDGFKVTSESHPDSEIPSLSKTFTATIESLRPFGGEWGEVHGARSRLWSGHQAVVFQEKLWVLERGSTGRVWSSPNGDTWTLETSTPEWGTEWGFDGCQAVSFAGRLWILGGHGMGGAYNIVWSSLDGKTWAREPNAAWPGRYQHQAVVFQNKLWVLGGYTGGSCLSDVWSSADGKTWTCETSSASWPGRLNHQALVFQGKLWVLGGRYYDGVTHYCNDVWSSSDGKTWEQEPDASWSEREGHQAVVFQDKLWVLGGRYYDGVTHYCNDVWSSSDGKTWMQEPDAGWSERCYNETLVFNEQLCVLGGYDGSYIDDVWVSSDGRFWAQEGSAGWSARDGHQVVVFQDELYLLGGYDRSSRNDVWSSSDGRTWMCETGNAGWSARDGHQVVVFQDELYLLGGHYFDGAHRYCKDVWHSANGQTWTCKTNSAGWSARSGHQAVVFLGKLWVLGGYTGSSRLKDVWSSPDGETWTCETGDVWWAGREGHQAVVFQNRLWVLGGYTGSRVHDVWSSPDGKAWTCETSRAAWSARSGHQAVVLQDKLWVLGGCEYDERLNDVWSSPDGKAWTCETSSAAWSGRDDHQAVAFRGALWILGGYSGEYCNDVWLQGVGSSDDPVFSYYYVHDENANTVPDTGDSFSDSAEITIRGSECPPGTHWFHVAAVDAQGMLSEPAHYRFVVTDVAPNVSSSTHPDPDVPAPGVEVAFEWDDGGVPDVVKYWYAWGEDEQATPTTQTADTSVSFQCVDAGVRWFVVQSEDKWGFKSPVGTCKVTIGMTAGPAIASATHVDPHTAYAARDVELTWTPAAGSDSPYYYLWDRSPYSVATAASSSMAAEGLSRTNLGLGRYFLHLRATDDCGHLTEQSHFAVRIREARPPDVSIVPTSSRNNVQFTWTDPDGFGTGTPRFHLAFDQNPSTVVTAGSSDSTSDYVWTEFNKPNGIYYFHIRSKDTYGNLSAQGDYTLVLGDAMVGLSAPSQTITTSGPVYYTVTYPGAISVNLTAGDVTLNKTGRATGMVSIETTADPLVKRIVIGSLTGDGTLSITIAAGTATYPESKTAPAIGPSGSFIVDNTAPTLTISDPAPAATSSGPVDYTLVYVGATDILLEPADVTLLAEPSGEVGATVVLGGEGNAARTITLTDCWGNGMLRVQVVAGTATDAAGNMANGATSPTVFVDTIPPTGSVVINDGATWTKSTAVSLGLTYSDGANGSGVFSMRFSNNGTNWSAWQDAGASKSWTLASGDGNKTVYAQFMDLAGNISTNVTDTIKLDATAPTGTLAINGGAPYAKDVAVSLSLIYEDGTGSGVARMRFSNDGADWSAWETVAATKGWTLAAGDGEKTVYVQFSDVAGNVSGSVSAGIFLDTVAPTGSVAINGGASFTNSAEVTLNLAASDPDPASGVDVMRFSNDGTTWSSWQSLAAGTTWTLAAGDGAKLVRAQFRDKAGNPFTASSASITLDTAGPSGTIAIDGGAASTNTRNITLTLTADDGAGSGVADMQFSNDGTAWSAWESFAASRPRVLVAGDGPKIVYVRFRDALGNESGVMSAGILLDTVAPTGTVTVNTGAEWTASTAVTLTLTSDDGDGSGAAWMRFSNDGVDWSAWEALSATRAWSLASGDGDKIVYLQLRDGAGNVSTTISDGIKLDTAAPTGTVIINGGAAYTGLSDVTLSLTADDGTGSGVADMRFSNDGTAWSTWEFFVNSRVWSVTTGDGVKTVHVAYRDTLGNFSVPVTAEITLDTTAPDVVLTTPGLRVVDPFVVTATFTDPVTGFDAADVVVTNGVLSSFSGTGNVYQWTVTPAGDEAVSVSVAAGVCVNPVDLPNTASNTLVVAIDQPPTANPQDVSVEGDQSGTITVSGSDPDGDTLTYRIVVPSAHGTLTGDGPNFVYTPDEGFVGQDSFTYVVNDGVADSAPMTVTITVTAPPVGSLTVTIEPEYARTAGAQWRVDGGSWHNSGDTVGELATGTHTVSFSDIPAEVGRGCFGSTTVYQTPSNRQVTVTTGSNTSITATYETGAKNVAAQVPMGGQLGDLLLLGFAVAALSRFKGLGRGECV